MQKRFVFVDESGDLAFDRCSSRFFTIGAVVTEEPRALERIPKHVRMRRLKKDLLRKSELKFHNSDSMVKKEVLERVAALGNVRVFALSARKARGSPELRASENLTYMQLLGELAYEVIRVERTADALDFIVDLRPLERAISHQFDAWMLSDIVRECAFHRVVPPRLRISRFDSQNSRGLQVADFVAGAIRRRHELGDSTYYDIIAPRIATEKIVTVHR